MLAAARAGAQRAGLALTLIEGRAEDLPESVSRFDLVTIGRALHWMDKDALGALFERLVAPQGTIAVCASFSARDGSNAWLDEYNAARRIWSDERLWSESRPGERAHRDFAAMLEGTGFHTRETIQVETTHEVSINDLAQRVLTFSSSSPAALSDKIDAMLADVQMRLAPFGRDGRLRKRWCRRRNSRGAKARLRHARLVWWFRSRTERTAQWGELWIRDTRADRARAVRAASAPAWRLCLRRLCRGRAAHPLQSDSASPGRDASAAATPRSTSVP